ncbi:MAG: T9SS type A sorting domain-containing protein [Bacteroidetes bacterium]|nr:T9SS type A sorting domain-containing protein [Bacteroidota bacterium]
MKKQMLLFVAFLFIIHSLQAQQSNHFTLKTNPHTFDFVKAIPADPDDIFWDNRFGATALSGNGDLPVYASAVDGNNLYFAGDFLYAGELIVNHIVKWDGTHWSALGSGMNDRVTALTINNGIIYAGGWFTTAGGIPANHIAKWDGTQWSALGTGITGADWWTTVNAIAFIGNDLYAGGDFNHAGGIAVSNLAKWNGSQWSEVSGGVEGVVNTLAVLGTDLYVGGEFGYAGAYPGGTYAACIARYDGSQWYPLGSGMDDYVLTITFHGTDLYAGGFFTTSGGIATNYIAKWDGSQWSSLNSPMFGPADETSVHSIAFIGNDLYAGGSYSISGPEYPYDLQNIAKWNGTKWSESGMGFQGYDWYTTVYTLALVGNTLYSGGYFSRSGVNYLHNIAKFNGTEWLQFGNGFGEGMDNQVTSLAVIGNDLYASGSFTRAGDIAANYVARWDGTQWGQLEGGVSGDAYALLAVGTDLYVAGSFRLVGPYPNDIEVNSIARFDGAQWHSMGTYPNFWTMLSLTSHGSDIYAGGNVGYLDKWDGTQWTSVGGGTNGYEGVKAMTFMGDILYAGGDFTQAGGIDASRIAKWDGTQWSTLGSGVNGQVRALLVYGNDLIVGGDFTIAGGNPAKYIAKWDGSQWSEFGGGMDSWVRSLALIKGELYAGGSFTKAGNDSINRFAKWTGSHWEKFGNGMTPSQWGNPIVQTIVPMVDDIYCGGTFEVAGGKPSSFIAKWLRWPVGMEDPGNEHKSIFDLQNQPNPFNQTTVISWQFPACLPDRQVSSSQLAVSSQVVLKVYDFMGKEVRTLTDGEMEPGEHQVTFDGYGLPAGVYFYQLQVNGIVETKKMIISPQ